jgi:hypothetical protein
MNFLNFFIFLRVFFALLDLYSKSGSTDLIESGSIWSGSETLLATHLCLCFVFDVKNTCLTNSYSFQEIFGFTPSEDDIEDDLEIVAAPKVKA